MRDRSRLIDVAIAAGLFAWASTDVRWWWRPRGHGAATPVVLAGLALALAQSIPFLWRRRSPVSVALVPAAALAGKAASGHNNLYSAGAACLVAAFGLGAYGDHRERMATRVLAAGTFLVALVVLFTSGGARADALPFALVATVLGMGEIASGQRDVGAAAAQHLRDDERNRLAREFHDVIAHQLSAIAVQAGAARLAATQDPAIAAEVVARIEQTARQGLTELNRLVGSLRHDETDRLDRSPQPTLDDLPTLVGDALRAGLPVELEVDGQPRALPATVELAGYRIVQESLTNALRYAGGAHTHVRVAYTSDGLDIHVDDEGSPTSARPGNGGGHGLGGLAERARMLGGRLEAGPGPSRGFSVHAWLPADR
jgi:signal transduction histidine kinase